MDAFGTQLSTLITGFVGQLLDIVFTFVASILIAVADGLLNPLF
jgi:hypothetical protein